MCDQIYFVLDIGGLVNQMGIPDRCASMSICGITIQIQLMVGMMLIGGFYTDTSVK